MNLFNALNSLCRKKESRVKSQVRVGTDFKAYNVRMPNSKGACIIDLIIPADSKDPFMTHGESYTPFIRIWNSFGVVEMILILRIGDGKTGADWDMGASVFILEIVGGI